VYQHGALILQPPQRHSHTNKHFTFDNKPSCRLPSCYQPLRHLLITSLMFLMLFIWFSREAFTSCRFSTPLQSSGLRGHASGTARRCQDDATYHMCSLAASLTKLFASAASCVLAHHRLVKKQAVDPLSPFHF